VPLPHCGKNSIVGAGIAEVELFATVEVSVFEELGELGLEELELHEFESAGADTEGAD
jgi:hypothetical protein